MHPTCTALARRMDPPRKVRSTITLGDARNLAKRGKIFRVISERDISLLLTEKLSHGARSFQSAGVSYWLRDISLLRSALDIDLDLDFRPVRTHATWLMLAITKARAATGASSGPS